jgi:amino-acid N-acetyltransferase
VGSGTEQLWSLFVQTIIRRARTSDVPAMKALVDIYSGSGRKLLAKELVSLYEDIQDFRVAVLGGNPTGSSDVGGDVVVGCGALHVLWADLGEIRTVAVHPDYRGHQIGAQLVGALIETATELGLHRLFALTFQTAFFARQGFVEIEGAPVDPDTYDALRRSADPGVAEFLGLEYVKPNTLGNTRMLRTL